MAFAFGRFGRARLGTHPGGARAAYRRPVRGDLRFVRSRAIARAIGLDAGLGDGYSAVIFGVGKGQSPGAELGVAIGDGLPFWQICIGAGDVRWARKTCSSDHPSRARGDAGGVLIRRWTQMDADEN